jgi:phosphotransferase system HPr (HPr) family protein
MITKELKVLNELGIHARVASRIVRCASGFESSVLVKKDGGLFDLKTVLGVMTLNTKYGNLYRSRSKVLMRRKRPKHSKSCLQSNSEKTERGDGSGYF